MSCYPSGIDVRWEQVDGPTLDLSIYETSSDFVLEFPACSLQPSATYTFNFIQQSSVTLDEYSEQIDITIQPETFRPHIKGGDKDHSETNDLELEVEIISASSCGYLDTSSFKYTWECYVT